MTATTSNNCNNGDEKMGRSSNIPFDFWWEDDGKIFQYSIRFMMVRWWEDLLFDFWWEDDGKIFQSSIRLLMGRWWEDLPIFHSEPLRTRNVAMTDDDGIPLSPPSPVFGSKMQCSGCSCIRPKNRVLDSPAEVALKCHLSGFAKTRVVCILEQLWRGWFFCCFATRLRLVANGSKKNV